VSETTSGVAAHVFPPALVSELRKRFGSVHDEVPAVDDDTLVELLTTIFFAGLETYEGEHNAVRVAFLGRSPLAFVMPEQGHFETASFYQWKMMPFESPRPFDIAELVKLAVAGAHAQIYSAVHLLGNNELAITGLAREGLAADVDPVLKVTAPRPGCLSIRNGRTLLIGYERGAVLTGGEHLVFSAGPVRRALERTALSAGLSADDVSDYLHSVESIVGEMASHGRGGIMIVSGEESPRIADAAPYRMVLDTSVGALIRLSRRLSPKSAVTSDEEKARTAAAQTSGDPAFGQLLRSAFVTETNRIVEELGALTAIDGAVLLNCELALVAFGLILPVGELTAIAEAMDKEGLHHRSVDLGSRGTRHRAGATYAAEHPGSIVFVASEDGHISCLYRERAAPHVLLWRLGPADRGTP
jgi:hypothetical protein